MQRLHAVPSRLPKTIFRAKDILNLAEKPDHPCILQPPGKRATITVGEPLGGAPAGNSTRLHRHERRRRRRLVEILPDREHLTAMWIDAGVAATSIAR
jgi:G3E family GTPase